MHPAFAGALTALATTLLSGGHGTHTLSAARSCFCFTYPSLLPSLHHMSSNRLHMSSSSSWSAAAASRAKRIFVALEIDAGAKRRLASSVSDIFRTMPRVNTIRHMLKWEREDKLHITLKFLGNVSDSDIPPLCRALCTEMEEMDAADILLRGEGIGTFSRASGRGPSTISVVWGGLKHESDKRVREVHAAVERACSRANGSGLRQDPRFHPHVTLARVKTRKNTTSGEMMRLAEFAEGLVQGECQGAGEFECLVAGVSLMEVQGDTTDYRRLDFFPFGAKYITYLDETGQEVFEECGQERSVSAAPRSGGRGGESAEEQKERGEEDTSGSGGAKRRRTRNG